MVKEFDFKINNINYKVINTDQYKRVTGILSFVKPLSKEDFTYYSLLNRLIGSSSMKYKTKKEISNKMFELYDCTIYMSTSYSYKSANTFFVFQTVNEKYVNEDNIIKECIELLKELMFNPYIENEGFCLKYFNEEVKALENDIKNIYNNKKKYAFRKLIEAIAPNDIISTSTLGDLEVLKTITPQSLYQFYLDLLNNSFVNVGLIGNVSKEEVIEYFKDYNLKSIQIEPELFPKEVVFKEKVQNITENQDIVQAKLMMGFRFNIDYNHPLYIPLVVFNAMFGSMFGSSLFMNIREKHSLTYDIASELMINKKILLVSCGVDQKNVELTSDLVIKDLNNYQNGIIDENILKNAKEFLINDLKELQDLQFSSLSFKLENILSKRPSINEMIGKIQLIKTEEIIEVSKCIKLDTIFTLMPGDENE